MTYRAPIEVSGSIVNPGNPPSAQTEIAVMHGHRMVARSGCFSLETLASIVARTKSNSRCGGLRQRQQQRAFPDKAQRSR